MATKTKLLLTLAILLVAVVMLACYSTACMTNDELMQWIDTGTPVACWK